MAGGVLIVLLLVAAALTKIYLTDLINLWWFNALGYEFYFWQRKLYRYVVFIAVSLIFFLVFFLNFWLASRFLKGPSPSTEGAAGKTYKKVYKAFQTGSMIFFIPLSVALSIPLAMPLYRNWEQFLFFVFGRSMGTVDPIFGSDVSFYLFSFPIYELLQNRLLIAFLILLVGLFILYMVKNRLQTHHPFQFARGAKWHLSSLVLLVFAIEIWDFILQRDALVYDVSHAPLFYGPGNVQMNVVLPLIWGTLILLGLTAIFLIVAIHTRKGGKLLAVSIVLAGLFLGLRNTPFLPNLVQTYIVKPNEIAKERPYIADNIQATLDAYQLTQVEVRDFRHERFPQAYSLAKAQKVLRNIPVWDAETLDSVFKQLQELRTYYTFPQVDVDRYTVDGIYQQVFLAAREIDYANLPAAAKNWINAHFTYTHGIGAVMTPASQVSGDPMTWFISNIPPESHYGIALDQPRIYYGMGRYPWAVAPNQAGEMDYPKGNSNIMADYTGEGGIPVGSLLKKLIFAYYFKDRDLFFSTKFSNASKMLMRRNIMDRIGFLTPYLTLDRSPYAVVTASGIYWIVDAYTTSGWYPAAAPYVHEGASLNYIRNSVKIVVDAYDGSVDFYIQDPTDPIIQAYKRIYPGLLKDKSSMPEDIRRHVRYPKDLFEIQMAMYAKYHQTDPQVFYQQEDLWTFAETLDAESTVPLKPYYLTLDLITPDTLDFLLLLPMFPKGRDNLRSLAIAGCDGDNYGKMILYNFPKGELVYGPAQIDALINQDPTIAQQFTLWDQAGSSVVRGKMIILPIGNSVIFIQPVYLKSTSRVKIPELQRIIMSEGQVAVMETSLEKAYGLLQQRVAEGSSGVAQRFPRVAPIVPESNDTNPPAQPPAQPTGPAAEK
ncbi:conserved membrane hypothetical protein [Desulfosarcina cetonica]|nr:conserved membrane hypothetical protein [Desulfosarcina cetonica]